MSLPAYYRLKIKFINIKFRLRYNFYKKIYKNYILVYLLLNLFESFRLLILVEELLRRKIHWVVKFFQT
jgi:hypothetical protein